MSVFAAATKRYRVTVNDVLLTALAGGIRRYLTCCLQANEVGVVLVALPVGEVNELTALRIVHRKMALLKTIPEATISSLLGPSLPSHPQHHTSPRRCVMAS
mmetsp:Transcript_56964/g.134103  ORF Transcript_56964/g.134103 Transcript_56964/m.134103 type:complete len:102 (-) Transcript_56964:159-464(-)